MQEVYKLYLNHARLKLLLPSLIALINFNSSFSSDSYDERTILVKLDRIPNTMYVRQEEAPHLDIQRFRRSAKSCYQSAVLLESQWQTVRIR